MCLINCGQPLWLLLVLSYCGKTKNKNQIHTTKYEFLIYANQKIISTNK